jgi:hypothetical protein
MYLSSTRLQNTIAEFLALEPTNSNAGHSVLVFALVLQ